MVKRQGSNVSWQNMAFLLVVADGEISRSMPQGGESNQPAQKPTPERPHPSPQPARSGPVWPPWLCVSYEFPAGLDSSVRSVTCCPGAAP